MLSILLIVGCDKKDDPAVVKCFLTEIVTSELSSTYAYSREGNLTLVTYTFEDGGNPVTSVITVTFDTNGNFSKTENGLSTETYLYDDDNRLTESKHFYDDDFTHGDHYVYNSSGQLIKTEGYEVNSLNTEITNWYSDYEYISTASKNASRASRYDLHNSSFVLSNTFEYEYDEKKKPYDYILADILDYVFGEEQPSENNIIKETVKDSFNNTVASVNYSYQYNENGYPTVQTASRVGSTTTRSTTYTYNCR